MTPGKFSEVDHDLLADYVGGALDGTPERVRVARLIEEDRAWAGAYAALAPAVELVRADLAGWAAATPEMPLAIAERLAAALAGAGPAPAPADVDVAAADAATDPLDAGSVDDRGRPVGAGRLGAPGRPSGGAGTVPVQPTGQRRTGGGSRPADVPARGTGPGRRARRWARIAGPVALAAASVGAVGLGLGQLTSAGDTAVTADRAAGDNAGAPNPLAAEPFRTTGPAQRSGIDYTPEQLSGANGSKTPLAAATSARGTAEVAPDDHRAPFAGGLDRLTGPDALRNCLAAITAEHATGAATVEVVDYASFQGRPALVVTLVDGAGARWAWVSGPECGVPGSGADTRFRTRVG
ncbi:hypothetical protein [Micromonospora coerulea]|uniref:hypothetical protein n=1 Tax=Micromonospora coerulea TaxID=47856 RepID=UPI001903DF04|nr:hypothetical protein [Micromonospora veneta]